MIIYMYLFQWESFYLVLMHMHLFLWCFLWLKVVKKLSKIGIHRNGWLFVCIYSNKKVFYGVNVYVFVLMVFFMVKNC